MPRIVKPPIVSKNEAREWLEMNEQGASPPQIAKKVDRDVRLVRKHIKLAAEDRAASEAKTFVFRKALEDHYRDFNRFLQEMDRDVENGKSTASFCTKAEWKALRQHIPSADVWAQIKEYEYSFASSSTATESFRKWVTDKVNNCRAKGLQPGEGTDADGINALLMRQAKHWLSGNEGLDLDQLLTYELSGNPEYVNLKAGGYVVGRVGSEGVRLGRINPGGILKDQSTSIILTYVEGLQKEIRASDPYNELSESTGCLNKAKERVHEGLETLIKKRVVAGHCKYCPF